jgi:pimeloyl-ACP methyl ester carboxylesterase
MITLDTLDRSEGVSDRAARQRARLGAAEREVYEHYGVTVTSQPLHLADPQMATRVVRCGSGPPTILFHGANLVGAVWAPLLAHLPDRSLYLVDLPGCGFADPVDYTGMDLAHHQRRFVGAVLDALELDRAALVGASLGGAFALRFALHHPERVTALALVSAPALALPGARVPLSMAILGGGRRARMTAALMPPPSARTARRLLASVGGQGSVRGVPEAMFEALGAAMALAMPTSATAAAQTFQWRTPRPHLVFSDDQLAGCPVPTLFLWGEDDRVQGPQAGARAAEVLPRGRIEVLPGGHGLWFEDPRRCGRLLTDFLAEAERDLRT